MTELVQQIGRAVAAWDGVSAGPHRFGGVEFRLGRAEVGHVHPGGLVDIAFPRPVGDRLVSEGRADRHHTLPDSGWVSFRVRAVADLAPALWLLKLGYLGHVLRRIGRARADGSPPALPAVVQLGDLGLGDELLAAFNESVLRRTAPSNGSSSRTEEVSMKLTLAPLPYPADALEPFIDRQTMQLHHDKHHQTYVDNYNKALEQAPQFVGKPLHEVLADQLAIVPDAVKTAVRNNGGGVHNHNLFWEVLAPNAGGEPAGNLARAIDSTFGSFDRFKEQFAQAAAGRFGSGWAWLVKRGDRLEVISTANQDSPLMDGAFPVVGLDVWEHAYYLKYQNKRADYIAAWWKVVTWAAAARRFDRAE